MKKSFKSLLAAVMLFSATLSANAQFSKKESNRVPDRFHMGLRAGVTVSSLVGDVDYSESLTFPTGGLGLDFQVAPIPIFVGIGLNYMNQGINYEYSYEFEPIDAHCIQMPITASYHINVAPNLFINPFIGPWFSVRVDTEDLDDDNNIDYGLRIGCGLNYGRLYFDMGYDLGFKTWTFNRTDTGNMGIFFATIGFNWAGSR